MTTRDGRAAMPGRRLGAGLMTALLLAPLAVAAAPDESDRGDQGRYTVDAGTALDGRLYVWRVDRETGRVSLCRAASSLDTPAPRPDLEAEPTCTPWSK